MSGFYIAESSALEIDELIAIVQNISDPFAAPTVATLSERQQHMADIGSTPQLRSDGCGLRWSQTRLRFTRQAGRVPATAQIESALQGVTHLIDRGFGHGADVSDEDAHSVLGKAGVFVRPEA